MTRRQDTAAYCETCANTGSVDGLTVFVERNDCDHDWQGWREFDDGHGGERVCAKCGMGAMHHSLMFEDWGI